MSRLISRFLSDRNYAIFLTAVFLVLGGISAYHHEMWRDEIQAWLLARDSTSVADLFRNLKYEGHPGLWHLCLMPLTRITSSPIVMQALHLIIAGASVYIFTRYSPFARFPKTLFAFGYFTFYEYNILCRNYALGVLLLFIFCALFERRFVRPLAVGIILFLLAHTSVHCLIITIAIGFGLFIEQLFTRRSALPCAARRTLIYSGLLIVALGIITSIIQLKPPADTGFAVAWTTKYDPKRLKDVFHIVEKAFIPIPKFDLHFWNSNIVDTLPGVMKLKSIISGIVLLWVLLILLGKRVSLLIYVSGTFGLLAFYYAKYFGSMRHHGFIFIIFIVSIWISYYCKDAKRLRILNRPGYIFRRYLDMPLSLILAAQLVGGVAATDLDHAYAFSQGKAVAEYIRESGMQDMIIVGEVDYTVSTIAGYLENKIHYVRGDRLGSFVIWDKARTRGITADDILKKAGELSKLGKQDILIILNSPLNKNIISKYNLNEVSKFEKAVVADEVYYLYLIRQLSPALATR